MCELLGMCANVPTDLCFSFAGLRRRGGGSGPHKDGWGVVFYEGAGIRAFHDPNPSAISEVASLLERYPIRSSIAMCHIRQANIGNVSLANTHPFVRELGGRYWTFAHNGQLPDHVPATRSAVNTLRYQPVGETDSEALFCELLNRLLDCAAGQPPPDAVLSAITAFCAETAQHGVFNVIISNGQWLFAFCSTRLSSITRRAPFQPAVLRDSEVQVAFEAESSPDDVVTVVATDPLTHDDRWEDFLPGEWRAWSAGELIGRGRVAVPLFSHPDTRKTGQVGAGSA